MQMLSNQLEDLDAVVFTHNHKDHTAGLDDIRPINHIKGKVIAVYAEDHVQETLKREYAYIFNEKDYPGIPQVRLMNMDTNAFHIGNIQLLPIRVWHMKLPVLGFRSGDFTYITDANRIDRDEMEKIKGTKILVLNALRHTTHYSHFSLSEALEIAERIRPEKTYLTHISHHLGLHAEEEAKLPEGVFLAHDGLTLSL